MSANHSSGTRPRHILLGVTGSIAAFKACQLASNLTKHGHEVRVMMTASATKFVGPVTFDSLTHTATRTAMFPAAEYATYTDEFGEARVGVSHIEDAKWADVVVIAPATANVIAKFASGIADDYLTSTTLAATCPKLVCPAMNVHMYENPATQRNIAECRELGFRFVDPTSGLLACQDVGKGRLAEPEDIEKAIDALLAENDAATDATTPAPAATGDGHADQPLKGLNVLVTAGPTQEPLDPVRYLTNHSTGKMGYALAAAARDMGAHVTLVSGPVSLEAPEGVDVVDVTTARDMFAAVSERFDATDVTVMAAAVGDFRAETASPQKIKKHGRTTLTLELVSNPDILAWAGEHKRDDGSQVLCGFAMETEHLVENAAKKLAEKHCDMLVANNLRDPGAGFATDTNVVTILTPPDDVEHDHSIADIERIGQMPKTDLARLILGRLAALRKVGVAQEV
ncbi:bifunctional phosphopantothenoylcysteine decarboxylase/phosphopantothenate--cysteine ligase CoaBC [Bifidobacterium sp. 82T24]|uniref:bifunctional phosphopantothenoylcysteine decarboxylase/phosphopantothenate--cysteine ligase CoaBC n=1 Tax=Bifidobacterium pluvialisilvae TaxID=2834436 RepID=UPI001C5736BD|nr:bifunctional phosphopantothenoylcysteine decarboxylase/phosphopantothenate--cysteine ligase CoaBC [Bifidobacterium pluvialisilvae]MBW3088482.1 bifunctional phosphopantothenoylcysteine decarboxylase/phosphopantothenate--cysteine ligase CoaBC [Bifidobacterium pluvialisilvae]